MEKKPILIMANGVYGDSAWYRRQKDDFRWVVCADGGANQAESFGIRPDQVVGDMDSIEPEQRQRMEERGITFDQVAKEKDFTDLQYALGTVVAKEPPGPLTIWGGDGGRPDHTVANLLCSVPFSRLGWEITFASPEVEIHLIGGQKTLHGEKGDTVTVLSLEAISNGVTLTGFFYPLTDAYLLLHNPVGISNQMLQNTATVAVKEGILAVFHFR